MTRTTRYALTHALAAAAAVLSACATDTSTSLEPRAAAADRAPALGTCDSLRAPAGSTLTLHVYATGVQIYRWNGASWAFVAPSATLFADAGAHGQVGTHYAGPTWESTSGSKVVGQVAKRCTPNATAIPWLSLTAASTSGPGIFERTTFLQRLYTVGGIAPSTPGSVIGEEAQVPYSAEYFFYR